MTALFARFLLSLALLVQSAGSIASEISSTLHPHCHMSASGAHGKSAKMPCCHCDECTVPGCASGCVMGGVAFIVPLSVQPFAHDHTVQPVAIAAAAIRSLDHGPPLRPPIA